MGWRAAVRRLALSGRYGMSPTLEIVMQVIAAVGPAVAVYGAIKADLARALAKAETAEAAANTAHARIDSHLERTIT